VSHFPNDVPQVQANRIAAKDPDDKGSMFIVRLDQGRVQISIRAPGERHESRICLPLNDWLKMIENYR
jgi:hypothetical protein